MLHAGFPLRLFFGPEAANSTYQVRFSEIHNSTVQEFPGKSDSCSTEIKLRGFSPQEKVYSFPVDQPTGVHLKFDAL
jgi:hypothetical protein